MNLSLPCDSSGSMSCYSQSCPLRTTKQSDTQPHRCRMISLSSFGAKVAMQGSLVGAHVRDERIDITMLKKNGRLKIKPSLVLTC